MSENKGLEKHTIGLILILIIQYLLGMYSNMFIEFPEHSKDGQLWVFAWHQLPLSLHILVGFALLIGAITLVIRSIKQKNRTWIIVSSISTFAIFTAITFGAIFVSTQKDVYSYVMAVSFIAAFVAFCWGLYKGK